MDGKSEREAEQWVRGIDDGNGFGERLLAVLTAGGIKMVPGTTACSAWSALA